MIQAKTGPIVVDGRKYPRFAVIYTQELLSPEIKQMKDATLRVWLLLNLTCNKVQDGDEREYWNSYNKLAHCSGRSRSTVYRALAELRKLGMISSKPTQGANRITLYKPPSLMGKKEEAMQKSQDWHSGDSMQGDTPGGSVGDTLTSEENISDTSVPVPLPHVNPKDTWKNIGGRFGPKHKPQAFDEEDMEMVCFNWNEELKLRRLNELIREELATLCRNQPEHFVHQMMETVGADPDLVRMMMKLPGFYQEFFGGE